MQNKYDITIVPGQSLQAAIDALPADDQPAVIRLVAGTWREKIALCRPRTTLLGAGMEQTIISWDDGALDPWPDIGKKGTFRSYTLRTDGAQIALRGLTVENTAAPRERVGQAVALYADGDGFVCERCRLRSHQDTLFTAPLPPKEFEKNGFIGPKQYAPRTFQRHVYRDCAISGDVDFIFGGAAAWFEHCDIITEDGSAAPDKLTGGYATAASTPEGQTYGYVFHQCRFIPGNVPNGTTYLGRPWREFAQTVLIECELGPHIRPEGWHDWGKAAFHEHGFYGEYNCYGPGAAGERAAFAHRLTENEARRYTMAAFMTADH